MEHQMSSMPRRIPFSPSSAFAAVFNLTGMTCDRSVRTLTSQLTQIQGLTSVYVELSTGRVAVASLRPIDHAAVAAAIDRAGYELSAAS
jgi:copper chaperone CopZ